MDIIIRNYQKTIEEILVGIDKDSFFTNWQENEAWEVSFTTSRNERNSYTFDLIDYEGSVILDGEEYVIKELKSYAVGRQVYKDVTATHVYYTIQDGYQYDTLTGTLSINQCLAHIFKNDTRGFSYEVINTNGIISRAEQENFGNGDYLNLINEVLKDYDVVVLPTNRHLRFYPRAYYGQDTQEQIRYKHNTDEVHFNIDTYALKTQIKGFGKKKEESAGGGYYFSPITYTSPKSSQWGVRIQNPVEDDRYTIASNMTARLKKDLHDYPDISGTVTLKWAIDVSPGDRVTFVYEPLNISEIIQIVGIKQYPMIPNKPPEVALSNTKKTMTSILAQLAKRGVK